MLYIHIYLYIYIYTYIYIYIYIERDLPVRSQPVESPRLRPAVVGEAFPHVCDVDVRLYGPFRLWERCPLRLRVASQRSEPVRRHHHPPGGEGLLGL